MVQRKSHITSENRQFILRIENCYFEQVEFCLSYIWGRNKEALSWDIFVLGIMSSNEKEMVEHLTLHIICLNIPGKKYFFFKSNHHHLYYMHQHHP